MTAGLGVRRLALGDWASLSELLDREPIVNVYMRSELRLGSDAAEWWGAFEAGSMTGACLAGSLLVPCLPDLSAAAPLAAALHGVPPARLLVGAREQVLALHRAFAPARVAREVRDPQHMLVVDRDSLTVAGDGQVRPATAGDLDALALAGESMHREEMGIDQYPGDASSWRNRMATYIDRGWSWVWTESGELMFKVELSAWTPEVVQLQGVYTSPSHRGRGIAGAGLAAVCAQLLIDVPHCALYVNHYNAGARRLYARLGFRPAALFATVIYEL